MSDFNKFKGTDGYVASRALRDAVNVAVTLERPLLLKGEPGTGKTLLAHHISQALDMELIIWNVKSTTKARDGLYTYDTVQRLNDARFGEGDVRNIAHYIKMGPLGRSFSTERRVVLLIDEVDKADVEFPNDLLHELDQMSFTVLETNTLVKAVERPVVVITSNAEKELPDAFLRRCVFHYIDFPEEAEMREIVGVHFPKLPERLLAAALKVFYSIREVEGLRKRPSTSELLDWIRALMAAGVEPNTANPLTVENIPFAGALVKMQEDSAVLERFARRPAPRSSGFMR